MKEQINDGGLAFPIANDADKEYHWINKGMTLRDYFAGQALVCAAAVSEMMIRSGQSYTSQQAAVTAYEIADAMLEARNKKP